MCTTLLAYFLFLTIIVLGPMKPAFLFLALPLFGLRYSLHYDDEIVARRGAPTPAGKDFSGALAVLPVPDFPELQYDEGTPSALPVSRPGSQHMHQHTSRVVSHVPYDTPDPG